MRIFFKLISFSKPYRHYIPEYVVYITLYILFGLLNFALLIPLFDVLFNTGAGKVVNNLPSFSLSANYFKDAFYYYLTKSVNEQGKMGVLIYVSVILLVCVLFKNLFGYLSQKVLTRMRINLVKYIREKLFEQFSTQSLQFFHKEKKGDLLATISGDVVEIENTVVSSIQTIFREPLVIISTFVMLFYLSKELTLFTLFFFPLSGFVISFISKKLRKKSNQSQGLLGVLLNLSEETISGIRIIKTFNAEKFVQNRYREENQTLSKLTKTMVNQRELASPISELLGVLVVVVIIIYGGNLVLTGKGNLTASAFIAYISFYLQIITPAKSIAGAITYLQRGLSAGERVIRILDVPQKIVEVANPKPIKAFNNKIEFKDVTFRYEQKDVLKNINIEITKGKMVALVGNSGGGKSTLTDLVPRFYDVNEGAILIDDINLKDVDVSDLRNLIGMVSQEAILFHDTIFNNIAFGSVNATITDVENAAKIANAHEFILQLKDGYNTVVGDRGVLLSGGQRQRITIARAVLKNAPILILDEATSALDSESEKQVQDALEKLMQNRTSIVIAHRLSTIRNADEIIVLNEGNIAEQGTHEALIKQNGIYKKLVDLQEIK